MLDHRSPSLDNSMWKPEMYYFFRLTEMSETVFTCILDDFNCDMLDPDKPPKEGRDFVDIIDQDNK